MRSDFQQWLYDLQALADKEDITLKAVLFVGLYYFFKTGMPLDQALVRYKQLDVRMTALSKG